MNSQPEDMMTQRAHIREQLLDCTKSQIGLKAQAKTEKRRELETAKKDAAERKEMIRDAQAKYEKMIRDAQAKHEKMIRDAEAKHEKRMRITQAEREKDLAKIERREAEMAQIEEEVSELEAELKEQQEAVCRFEDSLQPLEAVFGKEKARSVLACYADPAKYAELEDTREKLSEAGKRAVAAEASLISTAEMCDTTTTATSAGATAASASMVVSTHAHTHNSSNHALLEVTGNTTSSSSTSGISKNPEKQKASEQQSGIENKRPRKSSHGVSLSGPAPQAKAAKSGLFICELAEGHATHEDKRSYDLSTIITDDQICLVFDEKARPLREEDKGGRQTNWDKFIREKLLPCLMAMDESRLYFNDEVDYDSLPDYRDQIKCPMFFKKIEDEQNNTSSCNNLRKIVQVLYNCCFYNKLGSNACKCAEKVETEFLRLLTYIPRYEKVL